MITLPILNVVPWIYFDNLLTFLSILCQLLAECFLVVANFFWHRHESYTQAITLFIEVYSSYLYLNNFSSNVIFFLHHFSWHIRMLICLWIKTCLFFFLLQKQFIELFAYKQHSKLKSAAYCQQHISYSSLYSFHMFCSMLLSESIQNCSNIVVVVFIQSPCTFCRYLTPVFAFFSSLFLCILWCVFFFFFHFPCFFFGCLCLFGLVCTILQKKLRGVLVFFENQCHYTDRYSYISLYHNCLQSLCDWNIYTAKDIRKTFVQQT